MSETFLDTYTFSTAVFRPQTQPNWVYLLLQHAIDYNQDSNGQRADHTYQENGYN